MNRFPKINRKSLRTGGLAAVALALAGSLSAQALPYATENPRVELGDYLHQQVRFIFILLVVVVVLALLIVGMLSSKDPNKFSIMWLVNSITGKGAPDPKMDHDYDGITELDNPMPAYLRLIFIGSIIFAVVYLLHYHVIGTGVLQTEEYLIEMAEAEQKYQGIELPEDQLIMLTDKARIEKGKALFTENCATCHREDLGGITGPNLTDAYWLHGGDIKEVYATITEGVPGKTMISWKKRISSVQRLELASYILSLQGSNPPDPKAPEGVLMGEEAPVNMVEDSIIVDSAQVNS